MELNSISFLGFFVIVFALYYLAAKNTRIQNIILLIASYVFYSVGDVYAACLLLAATIVVYMVGIKVRCANKTKVRKTWTFIGISLSILLLGYFKYFNFFVSSFSLLFNSIGLKNNVGTFDILLPIGISFFTFRLISYLIEIYKENYNAESNFLEFATYISFFPTILSGPIDRPDKFIPQLKNNREFNYYNISKGCKLILWGMFTKMCIADNISGTVDRIWSGEAEMSMFMYIWGAILYSIQIYADFSGYSNMAIGIGKCLGIDVMQNFNRPYFAKSVSDFWRRWHISLSSWLRDYLYFPLGGNRVPKLRWMLNIVIVFSVCGLWHGAAFTFVLWGIYHAITQIAEKLLYGKRMKIATAHRFFSWQSILQIVVTFVIITFGWILFRAPSLSDLNLYIENMFTSKFTPITLGVSHFTLMAIFVLFIKDLKDELGLTAFNVLNNKYKCIKYASFSILLLLILLYGNEANSQFIYSQF